MSARRIPTVRRLTSSKKENCLRTNRWPNVKTSAVAREGAARRNDKPNRRKNLYTSNDEATFEMSFKVEIRGVEEMTEDPDDPVVELVMNAYRREPIRGSRTSQRSFQFSCQTLPPESIKRVIGELAESDGPIGLFVDEIPESDPDDSFADDFFSVPKLSREIAERFPEVAIISLAEVYHGFQAGRFSNEQLFASVLMDFARDPMAGYSVVVFRW